MIEIIQRGIENNSSKKSIADTPGKDKSTIGKEIKKHHTLPYKSKYLVECVDAGKCNNMYSHHCSRDCPAFKSFIYKDVPALLAHATAAKDTSASGSASTSMKLLLEQGQNLYVIYQNHHEIKVSEKTLYTYKKNCAGMSDTVCKE